MVGWTSTAARARLGAGGRRRHNGASYRTANAGPGDVLIDQGVPELALLGANGAHAKAAEQVRTVVARVGNVTGHGRLCTASVTSQEPPALSQLIARDDSFPLLPQRLSTKKIQILFIISCVAAGLNFTFRIWRENCLVA